jgi:hypothetical protein
VSERELDDEDVEIAECGFCHKTTEIAGEVTADIHHKDSGEKLAEFTLKACEECADRLTGDLIDEAIRNREARLTVVLDDPATPGADEP